jgi:hypothetical protein
MNEFWLWPDLTPPSTNPFWSLLWSIVLLGIVLGMALFVSSISKPGSAEPDRRSDNGRIGAYVASLRAAPPTSCSGRNHPTKCMMTATARVWSLLDKGKGQRQRRAISLLRYRGRPDTGLASRYQTSRTALGVTPRWSTFSQRASITLRGNSKVIRLLAESLPTQVILCFPYASFLAI